MGVKSMPCELADVGSCKGSPGGLKLDADGMVLNHESLSFVHQSMKGALGPRLVSFKGLISPVRDLRGRAVVPLALVAGAQGLSFLWQNGKPALEYFVQIASTGAHEVYNYAAEYQVITAVAALVFILTLVMTKFWSSGPPPLYLVDYACFKPGDECKMDNERFLSLAVKSKFFTEKSLEFQRKILENSGIGPETYIPLSMHAEPTDFSLPTCMEETKTALFAAVGELLAKTGVKAQDIGVLVVNCSTFTPIPSMSAMVVNHFKLREDLVGYNLGGMGCSAGAIGITLAQDLLKVHKETYAIVLSTECISGMQGYTGNDRSMMVGNCIFRWGASAVLMSNKRSEGRRAKYSLQHVVRTHKGADDKSFACARSLQDPEGYLGVALSRELMNAAGEALKSNITTLAPKILPLSEKVKFAASVVGRKVLHMNHKPYTPNFQTGIDHFCMHPGGKAVLDGIQKNLQLPQHLMEPARMTLHRFGNTSSSAIWYVLAYMEAKNRVRKNDLVWQIAIGSGMKCYSLIWKSLRSDQGGDSSNPWLDCVNRYPIPLAPSSSPSST